MYEHKGISHYGKKIHSNKENVQSHRQHSSARKYQMETALETVSQLWWRSECTSIFQRLLC